MPTINNIECYLSPADIESFNTIGKLVGGSLPDGPAYQYLIRIRGAHYRACATYAEGFLKEAARGVDEVLGPDAHPVLSSPHVSSDGYVMCDYGCCAARMRRLKEAEASPPRGRL